MLEVDSGSLRLAQVHRASEVPRTQTQVGQLELLLLHNGDSTCMC